MGKPGVTKFKGFEVHEWPGDKWAWAVCSEGGGYEWSIDPGYKPGTIEIHYQAGCEGSGMNVVPVEAFEMVAILIAKYPRKE